MKQKKHDLIVKVATATATEIVSGAAGDAYSANIQARCDRILKDFSDALGDSVNRSIDVWTEKLDAAVDRAVEKITKESNLAIERHLQRVEAAADSIAPKIAMKISDEVEAALDVTEAKIEERINAITPLVNSIGDQIGALVLRIYEHPPK